MDNEDSLNLPNVMSCRSGVAETNRWPCPLSRSGASNRFKLQLPVVEEPHCSLAQLSVHELLRANPNQLGLWVVVFAINLHLDRLVNIQ